MKAVPRLGQKWPQKRPKRRGLGFSGKLPYIHLEMPFHLVLTRQRLLRWSSKRWLNAPSAPVAFSIKKIGLNVNNVRFAVENSAFFIPTSRPWRKKDINSKNGFWISRKILKRLDIFLLNTPHYLITGKVPKKIALACDWYHLKAHIF